MLSHSLERSPNFFYLNTTLVEIQSNTHDVLNIATLWLQMRRASKYFFKPVDEGTRLYNVKIFIANGRIDDRVWEIYRAERKDFEAHLSTPKIWYIEKRKVCNYWQLCFNINVGTESQASKPSFSEREYSNVDGLNQHQTQRNL